MKDKREIDWKTYHWAKSSFCIVAHLTDTHLPPKYFTCEKTHLKLLTDGSFEDISPQIKWTLRFTHECENKLWKAIFDVCKQFLCTRHIEMHAMLLSLVFFFLSILSTFGVPEGIPKILVFWVRYGHTLRYPKRYDSGKNRGQELSRMSPAHQ